MQDQAWLLVPDIPCGWVYFLYNHQLKSWRLYRKYTHPKGMFGTNIQACKTQNNDCEGETFRSISTDEAENEKSLLFGGMIGHYLSPVYKPSSL